MQACMRVSEPYRFYTCHTGSCPRIAKCQMERLMNVSLCGKFMSKSFSAQTRTGIPYQLLYEANTLNQIHNLATAVSTIKT